MEIAAALFLGLLVVAALVMGAQARAKAAGLRSMKHTAIAALADDESFASSELCERATAARTRRAPTAPWPCTQRASLSGHFSVSAGDGARS